MERSKYERALGLYRSRAGEGRSNQYVTFVYHLYLFGILPTHVAGMATDHHYLTSVIPLQAARAVPRMLLTKRRFTR